ncbi:MAG: hypothetical protein U1F41_09025 [Burkholderiales bacterium]
MSNANAWRYDVSAISCGREQTLALLRNGKVIGWGSEGSGRVPSGEPEYCTTPAPTRAVEVIASEPMRAVAAGHGVSLGVTARREVSAWGGSGAGVDGRAGAVAAAIPISVTGVGAVRRVAAGEFQCAAIDEAGRLYTWGLALDGALGREASSFESPAARVPGLPALRDVAIGMGYARSRSRRIERVRMGRQRRGTTRRRSPAARRGACAPAHCASCRPWRPAQSRARAVHRRTRLRGAATITGSWDALRRLPDGTARSRPARARGPSPPACTSLALGSSGWVYAWGWNHHGQVGTGDEGDRPGAHRRRGHWHATWIAAGQAARCRARVRRTLRMGLQRRGLDRRRGQGAARTSLLLRDPDLAAHG